MDYGLIKRGYLKKGTKGLTTATQHQAMMMNWIISFKQEDISPMCRLYGKRDETISYIVSECRELAQNEYKIRYLIQFYCSPLVVMRKRI